MKSNIKNYKSTKIKETFDKKNIYFFFHAENLRRRGYIKIEQILVQNNFKIHRIKNNLLKKRNIINAIPLIYSTVAIGYIKDFNVSFIDYLTGIFKFHKDLTFISIVYDNKLYLPKRKVDLLENPFYLYIIFVLIYYAENFETLSVHDEDDLLLQ
jgi:hypothetical protein